MENIDPITEVEVMRAFLALLKTGADPKLSLKKLKDEWVKYKFKYPPMHWAAMEGKTKFLEIIASPPFGEDINAQWGVMKTTPLIEAIRDKRPESVDILLKLGANVKLENRDKKTAAYYAVLNDDSTTLKKLLKSGADIHGILDEQSLLIVAARKDFMHIADILIEHGAKVNQEDVGGYTALMSAARSGHSELTNLLIEKGALVNHATKSEYNQIAAQTTALMRAAVFGHTGVIQTLIEAGANLDSKDSKGKTAMMHAAENNQQLAMAILLSKGANESLTDNQNKTAFEILRSKATDREVALIQRAAIPSRQRHNAIVYPAQEKKESLDEWLKKIDKYGKEKKLIVKLLKIANFNDKQITKVAISAFIANWKKLNKSSTPLTWAIKRGNSVLVKKLVELDFDVSEKDRAGNRPLNLSVKKLDINSTIHLLTAGAYTHSKDGFWRTPWEYLAEEPKNIKEQLQKEEMKELISAVIKTKDSYIDPSIEIGKYIHSSIDVGEEIEGDIFFVKRVSHYLGLSFNPRFSTYRNAKINDITIREPYQLSDSSEGLFAVEGVSLLNQKLNKYKKCQVQKEFKTPWGQIQDAYHFHANKLKPEFRKDSTSAGYIEANDKSEYESRYKNNEFVVIQTGWRRHAVGVAFYKNKLIITNRGMHGDQSFGSKIYTIPDNKLHLINNLLFFKLNECKYQEPSQLHNLLESLVDIEQPSVKFPSKGQKHGTCSLVNQKSSLEAMLYLLEIDYRNASPEEAKRYARKQYKQFTHFIREDEMDVLINRINYKGNSKEKFELYLQIIKQIIIEHHSIPELGHENESHPRVKNVEMDRTLRLINALPKQYLDAVKADLRLAEPLKICLDYQANKKLNKEEQQVPKVHPFIVEVRKNLKNMEERLQKHLKNIGEISTFQSLFKGNQLISKQLCESVIHFLQNLLQDNKKEDFEKLFMRKDTSDDFTLLEINRFLDKKLELNQKQKHLSSSNDEAKLTDILNDIKKEFTFNPLKSKLKK